MKRIFFALLATVAAAFAQPSGYVTKSASGTTNCYTYFEPAARSAQVSAVDVTSDKAASVLSFQAGTGGRYAALLAATSTTTNLTLSGSGLVSNNLLLAVSGASVFPVSVYRSTATTNTTITLHNTVRTNVAAGDTVRERSSTYSTVIAPCAATSNLFFVDTVSGWATDMVAMVEFAGNWTSNLVASAATNTVRTATLRGGVRASMPYGCSLREVLTNYTVLIGAYTSGDTKLHVGATNGFPASQGLLIKREDGKLHYAVTSAAAVTTTNINLTGDLGVELAVGDVVWGLSSTAYTVSYPANQGDTSLVLDTGTGLASEDRVVMFAPEFTWEDYVTGTVTTNETRTITFDEANAAAVQPGARIWQLTTNVYSVTLPATYSATELLVAGVNGPATGIAAADYLVVSPATGGHSVIQVAAVSNTIYQAVQLYAAGGTALAAGDLVYRVATTNNTPVGAATLRLSPTAWALPQYAPARLALDGTSACSINSATVNYGP